MEVVHTSSPFPQRSFSLLMYFFAYRTKLLNVQYRQNFGNTFMNSLFICDHSFVIRQIPLLPVMRCYCSNTPICKALHSNKGKAFLPFPLSVLTPISYIINHVSSGQISTTAHLSSIGIVHFFRLLHLVPSFFPAYNRSIHSFIFVYGFGVVYFNKVTIRLLT
jgi:hypothetical protein